MIFVFFPLDFQILIFCALFLNPCFLLRFEAKEILSTSPCQNLDQLSSCGLIDGHEPGNPLAARQSFKI